MATGKGPAKQASKELASKKAPVAQKKVAASDLAQTPKKTGKPKK